MKTIREEWEDYAANVIPPGANYVQRVECKRAFYAGVVAVLSTLHQAGGKDVSAEEAVEMFQILMGECEQYAKDVAEGRA